MHHPEEYPRVHSKSFSPGCTQRTGGCCGRGVLQGILFGGDQLTVCRSRGAQAARCNDDVAVERLDGVTPVTEDWYARLTLMRVWCLVDVLICSIICMAHLSLAVLLVPACTMLSSCTCICYI